MHVVLVVILFDAGSSRDALPRNAVFCLSWLIGETLDVFIQSLPRTTSEPAVTSEHRRCEHPRQEFIHMYFPIFVGIDVF
jgi:hypothetical protein